jgi:glutaconate CoA-transferase subunit A
LPSSKLMTMEEALDLIEDGMSITISGITFSRNPMIFITGLIRAKKKDLFFIDREPGFGLDVMVAAGIVKRIRAAMATFEHFGLAPNVRKAVEKGEVEFIEDTCGAVVAALRAGAQGVPFMPVRGVIGSDLVKLHEKLGDWKVIKDPFNNEEILVVKAIRPDVAIIHVNYSDEYGNAVIEGPRYEDEIKIRAAKRVIITAERIVPTDYLRKYECPLSSTTIHVSAVVYAPGGAWPTAMYNCYEADYKAIEEYYVEAKKGNAKLWIENKLIKRWYR